MTRTTLTSLLASLAILASITAEADTPGSNPLSFVTSHHQRLTTALHKPPSPTRDAETSAIIESTLDTDVLVDTSLGHPCPTTSPCLDILSAMDESQRTETRHLLHSLLTNRYRHGVQRTLDYTVIFKGTKETPRGTLVRSTAATNSAHREPPVSIDYLVTTTPNGLRVIDVITEGSSLTKNYHDQLRKLWEDPTKGYPAILRRLTDAVSKTQ